MPNYTVYARRITDIETIVSAADPDEAAEIAANMDPNDRRWQDSDNSVLDDICDVKEIK